MKLTMNSSRRPGIDKLCVWWLSDESGTAIAWVIEIELFKLYFVSGRCGASTHTSTLAEGYEEAVRMARSQEWVAWPETVDEKWRTKWRAGLSLSAL